MPTDIFKNMIVMEALQVIKPSEENDYSDIPKWDGFLVRATEKALLLELKDGTEVWFPISHLRIAEDKQSIYASNWILEQKKL